MGMHAFTYFPGETPVHRCDARVKAVALLAFSIAVFMVRGWLGLGVLVAIEVAALLLARLPLGQVSRQLVPVYVLAACSVVFNVLANPSVTGLLAGLFLGVRMVVLVAASFAVCMTTSSRELLQAFSWFIGPLRHVRVPVRDIALTLALSLRFIPIIECEFETVRAAQKARGAELSGSFGHKLRIWGAAFSAVFIGLFRHADALATAMDARCYGARR